MRLFNQLFRTKGRGSDKDHDIPRSVDPDGVLARLKGDELAYTEDNMVEYLEMQNLGKDEEL